MHAQQRLHFVESIEVDSDPVPCAVCGADEVREVAVFSVPAAVSEPGGLLSVVAFPVGRCCLRRTFGAVQEVDTITLGTIRAVVEK
jgi:hypothetical protein